LTKPLEKVIVKLDLFFKKNKTSTMKKYINIYLLFFLPILMTSCNGQPKKFKVNLLPVGELVSKLDTKIWNIYQDQEDNYWFGSNGNGIFFYDGKKLKNYTTKDGLIDNTIRGIQGDHLGNIFIETPHGISKYDGKTFTSLKPIISPNNEWKLEDNDLWFNCDGHIYRYDGKSLFALKLPKKDLDKAFGGEVKGLDFKNMNHSPYSVFGINKDRSGNIWFGTAVAGAFRYDGKGFLWFDEKELSRLDDGRVPGVRSMIEDKDGNFWLSNFISRYRIIENDSIVKYEQLEGIDKSNKLFQTRLPYFNSGLLDKEGNLWMATYTGGVWKYDGKELLNFPVKNEEMEVLLISIYKDNQEVLWLGTDNDGVYKFNGTTFEKFEPMKKE
jgi:ligand-binding sensor domain-containing protein